MRRLSLGVWLATTCMIVAVLVIGILTPAGWTLLEDLATNDARARVELAAITARDALDEQRDETLVNARILAGRPTLARLVSDGDAKGLERFLETFRSTAGLEGCSVVVNGTVLGAAGATFSWQELSTQRGVRWIDSEAGRSVSAVAVEGMGDGSAGVVIVVRAAGASFLDALGERLGLEISMIRESERSARAGALSAARPLDASSALAVEAVIATAEIDRALGPARRALTLAAVVACAAALAFGFLSGRWMSAPLRALREAAARIGAGDLVTSVPQSRIGETAPLSVAMEGMRRRLRALTTELSSRETEAQSLLSGMVEGVFAVDSNRAIQSMNGQAATLLGTTVDSAVGRFCGDVLRPIVDGGGRPCDLSCPIVHARSRGSSRAVEHLELPAGRRTVVLKSAPETSGRQVVMVRDETETEAARRSRDAIMANLSHELRTPLSAQLASIELLLDGLDRLDAVETRELVSSLQRSTLRMTRLIDNLLESVRIETAPAQRRRAPVDVAAIVDDALAMTVPLLRQKGQSIDLALDDDLPVIEGDAGQLVQVLVNLVANAHKYAPPDGVIRIEAVRDGTVAEIRVDDAGPGVARTASMSIFDRFRRGVDEGDGLGLGLWIVKSIVERHDGSVDVAASPEGGARFVVRLPGSRHT